MLFYGILNRSLQNRTCHILSGYQKVSFWRDCLMPTLDGQKCQEHTTKSGEGSSLLHGHVTCCVGCLVFFFGWRDHMRCIEISMTRGVMAGIRVINCEAKEADGTIIDTQAIELGAGRDYKRILLGEGNMRPEVTSMGRLTEAHPNDKTRRIERSTNVNTPWFLVLVRTTEPGLKGISFVEQVSGKSEILTTVPVTDDGGDVLIKMKDDAVIGIRFAGSREIKDFCPRDVMAMLFETATSEASPATPAPNGEERPTLQ